MCKRLVEAMGGTIEFTSEPGAGSVFCLDMPRGVSLWPDPFVMDVPGQSGQTTILYVEDDRPSVALVKRMLEHIGGVRLVPIAEGQRALEVATVYRPSLILLDLHLPDASGFDVMTQLRAHPTLRRTPVVVLTADIQPAQREQALAAGATAVITKPLDVAGFLRTVTRSLGVRVGTHERLGSTP